MVFGGAYESARFDDARGRSISTGPGAGPAEDGAASRFKAADVPTRTRVTVVPPYRLDLTVAVLRRLSTNIVDRTDAQGRYLRALDCIAGPAFVTVSQPEPTSLAVEIDAPPGEETRIAALVQRMLGVDRDLTGFYAAAREVTWLHPLVQRMRGVKPPRYPTLWEACVNAIVFQQVSIHAAAAILGRTIAALGAPIERHGERLFAFPGPSALLAADDAVLRTAGLSTGKVATLRRVAEALRGGTLDDAMLEARTTPEASAVLCSIKGIGPWTAAVILLRGLGRLDLFPEKDSGAARSLALAAPGVAVDVGAALATLGPWRGLLYYHLLLARLETRGEIDTLGVREEAL
jgi:DNA-3-methyladenine glycosylase II